MSIIRVFMELELSESIFGEECFIGWIIAQEGNCLVGLWTFYLNPIHDVGEFLVPALNLGSWMNVNNQAYFHWSWHSNCFVDALFLCILLGVLREFKGSIGLWKKHPMKEKIMLVGLCRLRLDCWIAGWSCEEEENKEDRCACQWGSGWWAATCRVAKGCRERVWDGTSRSSDGRDQGEEECSWSLCVWHAEQGSILFLILFKDFNICRLVCFQVGRS